MFVTTILRIVSRVVNAVAASNQKRAERLLSQYQLQGGKKAA